MSNQERINISSGTAWENFMGYSRAVRIGNLIEVSGTTAVDAEGNIVGAGNPYEQTRFIIRKIEMALKQLDASLEDVIRTRIFVTDISRWKEIAQAHGEFLKEVKPVTTMVEVTSLIDKELLVEIEATAILN